MNYWVLFYEGDTTQRKVFKWSMNLLFMLLTLGTLQNTFAQAEEKTQDIDSVVPCLEGIWVGTLQSNLRAPYVGRPLFVLSINNLNGQQTFQMRGFYGDETFKNTESQLAHQYLWAYFEKGSVRMLSLN